MDGKNIKLAIHNRPGSFSDRWIDFCKKKSIDFKIVNCYENDIIDQIKDCDVLLWHHHHANYRDALFAKQLLFSLEQSGKIAFPNFNTAWHFDDKVGQKYLLELIEAPLVPSYVFYDKIDATKWAETTSFPKVFKLTGGAGSTNVSLVKSKSEAIKKIKIGFGRGFSQYNRIGSLKDRYNRWKNGRGSVMSVIKGIVRLVIPTEFSRMYKRERGYVYFQDFVPSNKFDIRVVVLGNKAFALKRMVRENDFRASGSGNIIYDKTEIDERCIKIAFDVNAKLNSQSIAYDFVFDKDDNPLIVEISYGYETLAYDMCPGYWSSSLEWHEGKFNPQEWMVENIIEEFNKN